MLEYDMLGFSEGLRTRARLESWPAFFALAAQYPTSGEMIALESAERDWHANDPELIRSAERDQTALVKSFRSDDDSLEQSLEAPLVREMRIVPGRSANAAVCWLDDDSQRIDLNLGLGLAIEDAVLSACCARGFATAREAASDLPPAFPMLLVGAEGSFRYHDYAVPWHRRLRRQRSLFVRQLPVDPARMAIADLLTALSFRWVTLHEQAHWLAGHMDYLRVSRHVLSAQLEQTTNLLQDTGRVPKQVIVDLGYRGVDKDNPGVQIIHRGKYKSLSDQEKRLLKRRQAIEPLIGHTKADHRMDRCWLQGALGDALHALSCAAGYNIRWLLRAIARLGLVGLLCALSAVLSYAACLLQAMSVRPKALGSTGAPTRNVVPWFGHSLSGGA